jgi:peptidyl-prolyl cis-trans isomerase C
VKSQYGWHIIKLDDVRALKVPSFEDLKPQIQQRLQQQSIQEYVAELRSKAKIE